MSNARLPLTGIRVIDFTWVGAGPFATKILADFDVEVVKIESATRPDPLHRAEPFVGSRGLEESGYFAVRNTNKKSVSINMKEPRARDLVLSMARCADVMTNSFSPKARKKICLEYANVTAVNSRIIFLSMPLAGPTGPYRDYIGCGMSIAAIAGMFALGGMPGRTLVGTGTNFLDHLPNPLHATFAVLAALAYRRTSGKGQEISISQIESTMASFPDAVLDYAANGHIRATGDHDAGHVLRGIYRCVGDDRWCAISVRDEAGLLVLCREIGRPDLAAKAEAGAVEAALKEWTAHRPAETVERRLCGASIAASVVSRPIDLLADDGSLGRRGFWQSLDHPVMDCMLYHGIAAKFSRTPTTYRSSAPLLGQNNAELPTLAGISADEYHALTDAGVIK